MSIDPDLAAEWAVDNALDADHDNPFAGDDPPPDWQPEPLPGEDEKAVGSAFVTDARRVEVPFSGEAPF
jgi:hypothetical protein